MKFLIILSCLLAAVHAKSCLDESVAFCSNKYTSFAECGAKYGHVGHVKQELLKYVNLHFGSSFDYLLMSTHYGGYEANREGMEKILRHLSDSTWNDAIELIKYMSKRGIEVPVDSLGEGGRVVAASFKLNEIQSLGLALDSQKLIAKDAMKIHENALKEATTYDPEVASFLENHFLHKHADVIRNLAGLTSDLRGLIDQPDTNTVSYFIFDEYLKKMM